MRIKSYKLFLESLKEELYKDEEYILHGLLTPLYDKYYDIAHFQKGCMVNGNHQNYEFTPMTPGKNKLLAYNIILMPTSNTKEEYTKDDIQDCYDNIEFDGMKVLKHNLESNNLAFFIYSDKPTEITEEYYLKELGLDQETFKKAEKYLSDLLVKAEVKEMKNGNTVYHTPLKRLNVGWVLKTSTKGIYFVNGKIWDFYFQLFNVVPFGEKYNKSQSILHYLIEKILNVEVIFIGKSSDINT